MRCRLWSGTEPAGQGVVVVVASLVRRSLSWAGRPIDACACVHRGGDMKALPTWGYSPPPLHERSLSFTSLRRNARLIVPQEASAQAKRRHKRSSEMEELVRDTAGVGTRTITFVPCTHILFIDVIVGPAMSSNTPRSTAVLVTPISAGTPPPPPPPVLDDAGRKFSPFVPLRPGAAGMIGVNGQ